EEGGFRFDPWLPEVAAPPEPSPGLRLQKLLMDAAWLKDELATRRHLLPATGQALQALTPDLPEVDKDFRGLPLRRVFDRLLAKPGTRLFDLSADEAEAPLSTRLAVA